MFLVLLLVGLSVLLNAIVLLAALKPREPPINSVLCVLAVLLQDHLLAVKARMAATLEAAVAEESEDGAKRLHGKQVKECAGFLTTVGDALAAAHTSCLTHVPITLHVLYMHRLRLMQWQQSSSTPSWSWATQRQSLTGASVT